MPLANLTANDLRSMLQDGQEVAVIDTREEGVFAEGHLLLAASLPLSRIELDAGWRIPRRDTRVVLVDVDTQRTARAAAVLSAAGYSALYRLQGFPQACAEAGLGLFSGKYVPSKAFGEVVETACHTPRITATELQALQREGRRFLLVDSRTPEEFHHFALPGALSCPGAELALRVPAALPEGGIVLVNCAGRTRSIIGAQSLINTGLRAPVYAIENGTMGWHLQGLPLDHGRSDRLAPAPTAAVAPARLAALGLLERTGGRVLAWGEVQALLRDAGRTTYVYDVRLRDEMSRGPVPGARNASGGELVQSTDYFAPVRHARIVLVDADLVQAPMTAHWLRQMGWEADVLDPATVPAGDDAPGPGAAAHWLSEPAPTPAVPVQALRDGLAAGTLHAIDCGDSIAYRHGHVPGAWFASRGSLPGSLDRFRGDARPLVFVSPDGATARFAAADAAMAGFDAAYLSGGLQAWSASGGALEAGWRQPLSAPDDIWYSPYEVAPEHTAQAMRDYIAWETGLLERIGTEPGVHFKVLRPRHAPAD